ncbi:MAG: CDP-alcohol phosphatidyltransferase family protein [Thermomicrobium sp.]|nr:CDP-alcohol phosphatidyltransferase family protein [Thermomicrobium sp.]
MPKAPSSRSTLANLAQEFRRSLKQRPAPEYVNLVFFRPLGFLLARSLVRTPVRPVHLVLAHTALGLTAALSIVRGADRSAAVLLQAVTILDNADGQLARLRREETELGRYLDTELDGLVDAALFAAIWRRTGQRLRSLAAFLVLTLLLSWDFNVEYLYRSVRGERFRPAPGDRETRLLALARTVYRVWYEPQDRLVRWIEKTLFALAAPEQVLDAQAQRAWWSRAVTVAASNLGLSTQYAWLGIFLWKGWLHRYPSFVLGQLLVPVVTTAIRWRAVRNGR